MHRIISLKGQDLKSFVAYLADIVNAGTAVYQLRVTVDADQVKLKTNARTWTPGFGGLDPECRAAHPEPNWLRDPKRCVNGWHRTAPARMLQWCPECPTHPDVDPRADGYRAAAEEGPTDWVQRLRPDRPVINSGNWNDHVPPC